MHSLKRREIQREREGEIISPPPINTIKDYSKSWDIEIGQVEDDSDC